MMRNISALAAGVVFGLGIAISGMGDPAKVMNFFDIFGTWDASLALVMAAALAVAALGYRLVFAQRSAPLYDAKFHLPTASQIDGKLLGGSAVFGIGWGVTGFCPGGAIPALGFAPWPTALFLVSMALGIVLARQMQAMTGHKTAI